jgi:hypothetical protein
MNSYFLDSSAIVKRYKTEVGTLRIEELATNHSIILCEITLAEVAATFAGIRRATNGITQVEYETVLAVFLKDCNTEYNLVETGRPVINRAVNLTRRHRLRGYDAVQLATALTVNDSLVTANLFPLTFVAADNDLLQAAKEEGLLVENPSNYR